jgi:glutaredoxin-dependent peroxiredoxin
MSLVGQTAPAFTLLDTARKPVSLSDFSDKKVVIAFFPAAFTGVCEKELCTFRDSLAGLNDVGATVLGISVDAPFSNGAFATKNSLTFPLLSDYSRDTVRAYGVELPDFAGMKGYIAAQRSVFVVDGSGTVTWQWVAPNPGVEPDYDAVRAALA